MCYNEALVMPSNYAVVNDNEMEYVEGGGPRAKDRQAVGLKGTVKSNKASTKLAISYTLGYLSLATCFNIYISAAFGFAGLIYTCS